MTMTVFDTNAAQNWKSVYGKLCVREKLPVDENKPSFIPFRAIY